MNNYLLQQLNMHAFMQPEDLVKMAYQAVFGPNHLLSQKEDIKFRLKKEFEECEPESGLPLFEDISEEYTRVNLGVWKGAGYTLEKLWEVFEETLAANLTDENNTAGYRRKKIEEVLKEYKKTLESVKSLQFSMEDYEIFVSNYIKNGIVPINHSETYRKYEKPHYRLVKKEVLKNAIK